MATSYKKLWKLLIDKDMKKKDLAEMAEVSNYTLGKLTRGENVTTDVLVKICKVLECDIGDIMEIVEKQMYCFWYTLFDRLIPLFEDVKIKTSNQTEVFYYGKQKFN